MVIEIKKTLFLKTKKNKNYKVEWHEQKILNKRNLSLQKKRENVKQYYNNYM